MRKFILVKTTENDHHSIAVDQIKAVSPKDGKENKSEVATMDGVKYFSIETVAQIHTKIRRSQLAK